MPDDPAEVPDRSGNFLPKWLTPRRAAEFARNVVALEKHVGELRDENRAIRGEIDTLKRQLTEHNAKLQVLVDFVHTSVTDRIDSRAELVVRRLLEPRLGDNDK